MEINRNQYFLVGLVLLFLGIQFRLTQSMTLTPEATRALAEYYGHPVVAASNTVEAISGAELSIPPHTLRPPEWLGWCLASVGAVLILHSFAMPRPG